MDFLAKWVQPKKVDGKYMNFNKGETMLNPNEAPKGYVAIDFTKIKQLYDCDSKCEVTAKECICAKCSKRQREDKTDVYFIKMDSK